MPYGCGPRLDACSVHAVVSGACKVQVQNVLQVTRAMQVLQGCKTPTRQCLPRGLRHTCWTLRFCQLAAGVAAAPFTTRGGEAFRMYRMPSGIPAYIFEGIIEPDIQSGASCSCKSVALSSPYLSMLENFSLMSRS